MAERTLVLRKSHGPFSSGTAVTVIDKISKHLYTVEPNCVEPDSDNYLEVYDYELVELRNRTDLVPIAPRWLRRDRRFRSGTEAIS